MDLITELHTLKTLLSRVHCQRALVKWAADENLEIRTKALAKLDELMEAVASDRGTPLLWAVDINDGLDCRPMTDKAAAEAFVSRYKHKPGVTVKVVPWRGSAAGHANILALEAALR